MRVYRKEDEFLDQCLPDLLQQAKSGEETSRVLLLTYNTVGAKRDGWEMGKTVSYYGSKVETLVVSGNHVHNPPADIKDFLPKLAFVYVGSSGNAEVTLVLALALKQKGTTVVLVSCRCDIEFQLQVFEKEQFEYVITPDRCGGQVTLQKIFQAIRRSEQPKRQKRKQP